MCCVWLTFHTNTNAHTHTERASHLVIKPAFRRDRRVLCRVPCRAVPCRVVSCRARRLRNIFKSKADGGDGQTRFDVIFEVDAVVVPETENVAALKAAQRQLAFADGAEEERVAKQAVRQVCECVRA